MPDNVHVFTLTDQQLAAVQAGLAVLRAVGQDERHDLSQNATATGGGQFAALTPDEIEELSDSLACSGSLDTLVGTLDNIAGHHTIDSIVRIGRIIRVWHDGGGRTDINIEEIVDA